MAKQKEAWKNEENKWYQQAVETAQALKERPAFSYAPERDPLYQAAKQTAVEQGRRAMEDTLGKTAGLSGGYASSYAQSVGTQAYDRQISKLRELLPDYYDRARANYDRETDALHDTLSTALGLYDKDYQSWLDRQSALEREAEAERKQNQWEAETAESRRRWDIEAERKQNQWEAETAESRRRWDIEADRKQNQWEAETAESRRRWDIKAGRKQSQWEAETAESKRRWEAETAESKRRWDAETNEKQLQWLSEFAEGHDRWTAEYQQAERKLAADQAKNAASRAASEAEKERSYAYRMAILALQQGVSVSDALLKAAGIDKAYAESLRRYYAYRR